MTTAQPINRNWRLLAAGALMLSGLLAGGCNLIKPLAYFLRPEEKQKAEFEFAKDARVLIMVDPARPEYESPIFSRALYDHVCDIFREKKSTVQLLSPREVTQLRRSHSDFDSWSVQRIGRELNADNVIWLKVDRYQMRQQPQYPVLEPMVELRMKVIAVDHPATDARVWPAESKEGRKIACSRPMREAADASTEDMEAKKMAQECAWQIAFPFFEQNLEENPPRID